MLHRHFSLMLWWCWWCWASSLVTAAQHLRSETNSSLSTTNQGIALSTLDNEEVEGYEGVDIKLDPITGNLLVLTVWHRLDRLNSLLLVQYSNEGEELSKDLIVSYSAYEGEFTPTSMALDGKGKLYFAGSSRSSHLLDYPGLLVPVGNMDVLWGSWSMETKSLLNVTLTGSTEADFVHTIAVDAKGEIFLTGNTAGSLDGQQLHGQSDLFLMKYTANGEKLFTTLSPSMSYAEHKAILFNSLGQVLVVSTRRDPSTPNSGVDTLVTTFSSKGMKLKDKVVVQRHTDHFLEANIDTEDTVLVTSLEITTTALFEMQNNVLVTSSIPLNGTKEVQKSYFPLHSSLFAYSPHQHKVKLYTCTSYHYRDPHAYVFLLASTSNYDVAMKKHQKSIVIQKLLLHHKVEASSHGAFITPYYIFSAVVYITDYCISLLAIVLLVIIVLFE